MSQTVQENINNDEPLWTPLEVATYLKLVDLKGVPRAPLVSQLLIADPNFPRPRKLGKGKNARNRFEPAEIRAYRAALRRQGEDAAPALNADGSVPKKRGRKPKAKLGGGAA